MRVGIVSVCVNIVLNLTLSRVMGAMGLTLATTTAALTGATLQLILLHKKDGLSGPTQRGRASDPHRNFFGGGNRDLIARA